MNDTLIKEIEDLQVFADPFEEFRKTIGAGGWSANFVRRGEEIALRRDSDGSIKTMRGPGQRKYRNFKGLLISETFANLRRLANAQKHITRNLTDPKTGEPKDYLPNAGDILCGSDSAELTFESVCDRLERQEDKLRVFVVNGVAGVGKSHLIERIVRQRAAPTSDKLGSPLLLHVESRGKVLTSLSDRIAGTLASLRASFVEEELKPLIRRGAIQIAIDGFDELSDSRGYVRAWGALRDFIRDLQGQGTCLLAGRDTMLDGDTVREGLGNTVGGSSVTFLRVQHPPAREVRDWLARREEWRGRKQELKFVERQVENSEYLRRPFFIVQLAELGPDGFRDAQGEPIVDLMDGVVRREGHKLTGASSDIDAELASELYGKVLSEAARIMMDDETNSIEVDIVGLIIEEVFADYADREMVNALVQRAGTLGLLEMDAGDDNRRTFPHETVKSYFFARNTFDYFPKHGATVGLHRVPLGADDFRIFNRVARRTPLGDQRALRKILQDGLRTASGHDYLRTNFGGLLLAFTPLKDDEAIEEDGHLSLGNLELRDVWMADLLGSQIVSIDGCVMHRLDVRGADLSHVHFANTHVFELLVDPYVRFGASAPTVDSLVVYENFKEERWQGSPGEWIEKRTQRRPSAAQRTASPDEKWYLLERFARISMRQFAIRSGRVKDDPASRRILESPLWPDLRELLVRHGRLEVPDNPDAAGPRSEWYHLVAGAEFLEAGRATQESTRNILRELNVIKDLER